MGAEGYLQAFLKDLHLRTYFRSLGALWQPEMGVLGLMLSDFSSQRVPLRRAESLLSSMQHMANSTQTRTGASIWRGVCV